MKLKFNKLRRNQKRLIKVKGTERNRIFFTQKNNFILKSISYSLLTEFQLKAAYNLLKKKIKKNGHIIPHVFCNIGLTKKPVEVRMGKGKGGKIACYVYPVRPGKVIFELVGVNSALAEKSLTLALGKLPIFGKIIQV